MSETKTILDVPQQEFDGVLALDAMLRKGLEISVYPRQVLITDDADELNFVHGLPGTSMLAPVTFAQDKRIRRAMLERGEIPLPKSSTFTMGHGVERAQEFAASIGYPVVVKPGVGDNTTEVAAGINNSKDFAKAIHYLQTPTTERSTFTRSAYGLTELRQPGNIDGRIVVPPAYRFVVEKHLHGHYLRFLSIAGEIRSIVDCEGNPGDGSLSGGTDITDTVHPGFLELAQQAAGSIPHLGVATVDFVVPEPSQSPLVQEIGLVDYSERPGLWVQHRTDPALARRLATEVLDTYAAAKGVNLGEEMDSVVLAFEAHALPNADEGAEAIARVAPEWNLEAVIDRTDRVEGSLFGTLSGDTLDVALFVDALLEGEIEDQRVMLAVLKPQGVNQDS